MRCHERRDYVDSEIKDMPAASQLRFLMRLRNDLENGNSETWGIGLVGGSSVVPVARLRSAGWRATTSSFSKFSSKGEMIKRSSSSRSTRSVARLSRISNTSREGPHYPSFEKHAASALESQ
ncbi:hypothetical protein HAX54_006176 [Datura stramonium]|uniref:Uncharacterized protein n=1 Tax=Datura stramonium TaxID=4076 RepID=A0ABS8TB89_DATST|nr:hypothetical protein [Datura stramonium]